MIEGSCLCGAVRFSAKAMSGIVECHCAMCRKAAGGHAGFFFVSFRRDVTWQGAEHLTQYESSPGLVRRFCARCGTAMTGANLTVPDATIILAANALDGEVPARVVAQEYCASKAAWAERHDGAPSCEAGWTGWEKLRP